MKLVKDERGLEKTVFSFEILICLQVLASTNRFSVHNNFYCPRCSSRWTIGRIAQYMKVSELSQKAHMYEDLFPDHLTRFLQSPGSPNDHIVRCSSRLIFMASQAMSRRGIYFLVPGMVVNASLVGCTLEMPIELWVYHPSVQLMQDLWLSLS